MSTRLLQFGSAAFAVAALVMPGMPGRVHAQTGAKASAKAPGARRLTPSEFVMQSLAEAVDVPIENPAALIPFFEQLYRRQQGELPGPVRVLQYGDSHTAADNFTGALRERLQASFGNGGSGFSMAGRPWKSYRRFDLKSGSSDGWYTDGLATRSGDGVYGLGGISMSTSKSGESLYMEAEAADFELFFYRQPGGGALLLSDYGAPLDLISTAGEPGPAYYHIDALPGPHRFEITTLETAPVRLFGWVAENPTGVTYETLGINGAQASIVNRWDETTLRDNLLHRDPSLIVVAYGTNEAGQRTWTLENYKQMFAGLLAKLRAAAPTASILVIGPPDRAQRVRRKWTTLERIGVIATAQREAALESGAAFVDLRMKMGGPGAMLQWVKAGQAQSDHVHFTASGYRLLADSVFHDLIGQYATFLDVRRSILAESTGDVVPADAQ